MPLQVSFRLSPDEAADELRVHRTALQQGRLQQGTVQIIKRSLDARGKLPYFQFTAMVFAPGETVETQPGFIANNVSNCEEVHIIGFGPAGMFAALQLIEDGYKPVIFERGKEVKARRRDLAELCRNHVVDADSNYCFGEGGAGTYSDGKRQY